MNKYIMVALFGIAGGLLGEEIGVQCTHFLPKNFSLSDSPLVPLLVLIISFVPFFAIMFILLFKLQGYTSFGKGFCFSLAYYLPFQYKAIWGNLKNPNILPSETFSERVLVTLLGALFLSGIYYLFIRWQNRLKRSRT